MNSGIKKQMSSSSNSIKSEFEESKRWIDDHKSQLGWMSQDEMGALYGYYKQATLGNNKEAKPWMWELEKTAKWNYWTKLNGMSKSTAMQHYVLLVNSIKRHH